MIDCSFMAVLHVQDLVRKFDAFRLLFFFCSSKILETEQKILETEQKETFFVKSV